MFSSVLVANRGEIAVRIIRTLRTMGIRSVVVASIPDRHSMAVRHADDWVLLEGYSATESYLDMDTVIAAAKEKGCEAIHPGYGFLSERADFAERCGAEGIVFVGPPPVVLRGLGDKSEARRLAVENGVPVVPGWDGADDSETLVAKAGEVGFPVMIKARGGGGGRGMRPVHHPADLPEAIESARREAQAAFGDGGLLLEKLVTKAHHVEVQVLADAHGNFIHLGERDCSVQRRRQKLIEETPSPVVDAALQAELTDAALKLAWAVNYVNAGTFEFLVAEPDAHGKRPFYFLEVNPRLQVEHPVTEMVTGLDLVELQLRIAAGESLPLGQEDVRFHGHAIEFRINAEDPWNDFRPSTGRMTNVHWGEALARCDVGFESYDVVPTQYDSLLGKVIVHGETREDVLDFAVTELQGTYMKPLVGNVDFHLAILATPTFRAGDSDISWLGDELEAVLDSVRTPEEVWSAAAAALASTSALSTGMAVSVWLSDGKTLRHLDVRFDSPRGGFIRLSSDGTETEIPFRMAPRRVIDWQNAEFEVVLRDNVTVEVRHTRGTIYCDVEERDFRLEVAPPPPLPRRTRAATEGATAVTAPLAGTIATVRVAEGDAVEIGDLLLTLEAMKMEHRVTATSAGTVKRLAVREGQVVSEGDLLVEVG